MRCGTAISVCLAFILAAATAAPGQQQERPLPRPVTPPVPIPGRSPATPAQPAGSSIDAAPHNGPDASDRPAARADDPINAVLDNQTLAVARFDLADVDLKALEPWVVDAVDESRKAEREVARAQADVRQELDGAFRWIDQFRAAGASRLYVVLSLTDINEGRPPFLAVPLAHGADPQALERLILSSPADRAAAKAAPGPAEMTALVRGDMLLIGVPGTLDRLKAMPAATAGPDLGPAFGAAGKGQIHIAFLPQRGARQTLENLAPTLPDVLGGGPIQPVSQGLQWAALAADLPPTPSLHFIIQARDEADAKRLQEIVDRGIAWLDTQKQGPWEMHAYQQFAALMKPHVEGRRLVAELTGEQTRQFAGALAAGFLQARTAAKRVISMHHLRQLATAVHHYAVANDDEFPKGIGRELDQYLDSPSREVWTDPLRPNQQKPYVYVRLADKLGQVAEPDRAVMIYENHSTWDNGVIVAYADGHSEWITDENEFKQMLADTKKRNPKAVETPQ